MLQTTYLKLIFCADIEPTYVRITLSYCLIRLTKCAQQTELQPPTIQLELKTAAFFCVLADCCGSCIFSAG